MDPQSSPQPSAINPPSERERLECLKLEIEIAKLKKPLWTHAGFWTSFVAIALPIIGAVVAWSSGWFDLKQLEIKNGNLLLDAENRRLLAQKETLTSETAKLEASRIALNIDVEKLNQRRAEEERNILVATNELVQLQRQRDEKEEIIKNLTKQLSETTKENEQARTLLTKINELQTQRDKAETKVLELRAHLAAAHDLTRSVVTNGVTFSQASIEAMSDAKKIGKASEAQTMWAFSLGKWRAAYESDFRAFGLGEFDQETNGNTSLPSAKKNL